jgi:hypothetical protein
MSGSRRNASYCLRVLVTLSLRGVVAVVNVILYVAPSASIEDTSVLRHECDAVRLSWDPTRDEELGQIPVNNFSLVRSPLLFLFHICKQTTRKCNDS